MWSTKRVCSYLHARFNKFTADLKGESGYFRQNSVKNSANITEGVQKDLLLTELTAIVSSLRFGRGNTLILFSRSHCFL